MLETADRLWGQILGTWLNIGGLGLLVVGNAALASLQAAKSSLRSITANLDGSPLAVRQRVYPNVLLMRVRPNYR